MRLFILSLCAIALCLSSCKDVDTVSVSGCYQDACVSVATHRVVHAGKDARDVRP